MAHPQKVVLVVSGGSPTLEFASTTSGRLAPLPSGELDNPWECFQRPLFPQWSFFDLIVSP